MSAFTPKVALQDFRLILFFHVDKFPHLHSLSWTTANPPSHSPTATLP
eukprot:gene1033-298_t